MIRLENYNDTNKNKDYTDWLINSLYACNIPFDDYANVPYDVYHVSNKNA